MRKILIFTLSLIIVLMSCSLVFANSTYEINPITGEVISTISGDEIISTEATVSSDCVYNKTSNRFIFYLTSSVDNTLSSSVYDGETVTGKVYLNTTATATVGVYMNGSKVSSNDGSYELKEPGSYIVRNENEDYTILSFTILNSVTNISGQYQVPNVFDISDASVDGTVLYPSNGTLVDITDEGEYVIRYSNSSYGYSRAVTFTVDYQAPELEILGLTDGVAKNPVSFGDTEADSTLVVLLNGDEIKTKKEYTEAGKYHVEYTDAAGNMSTYDFTIKVFLNINAGIVLGIIGLIIIGVIGYMIYLRKNMKTF